MKKHFTFYLILTGLALSIFLYGCGSSSDSIEPPEVLTGAKEGFILVPDLNNRTEKNLSQTPGVIIIFTNNIPEGYIPLSGAEVSLNEITKTTGADGYFIFENIPVGIKTIKVLHNEWISIERETIITDEEAGQKPFTGLSSVQPVPANLILTGNSGKAVFNFESYGTDPNNSFLKPDVNWSVNPPGSIDENGIFQTEEGGIFTATAKAKSSSGPESSITFTVTDTAGIVYGYVKTTDGSPVEGAAIRINNSTYFAVTDINGYYELPGIPSSTVSLSGTASGVSGSQVSVNVPSGQAGQAPDIIIDIAVAPPTIAPAPASWQINNRASKALTATYFTDSQNGWAVGEDGTLLKTPDEGNKWYDRTTGSVENLNDLYFTDINNGWAVGEKGTILYSSNQGNNWAAQTGGTTANLTGIHFINSSAGWIAGEKGTILKTSDGGTNWKILPAPSSEDFTDIHFVNFLEGWITGKNGLILHSSDGGNNWSSQTVGTEENLNSIQFINLTAGWAAGDKGTILKSTDGGKVWNKITAGTEKNLNSIMFVDNLNGWTGGMGGTILYSGDGGNNWISQLSGTEGDIYSLHFLEKDYGWAVGREEEKGIILKYSP